MLTTGSTQGQPSIVNGFLFTASVPGTPSVDAATVAGGENRASYRGRAPSSANSVSGAPDGERTGVLVGDSAESGGRVSHGETGDSVDFVYDIKGNVRIKFMDSMSNLVYQLPPELYYRMSSRMGKGRASVNTRV